MIRSIIKSARQIDRAVKNKLSPGKDVHLNGLREAVTAVSRDTELVMPKVLVAVDRKFN